mmetsp:Transcript_235/g.270  ORF Transcript_235/g.270 Transcript_235/m.270 type:complete len:96 (-) Transcript_235:1301-1588(-)
MRRMDWAARMATMLVVLLCNRSAANKEAVATKATKALEALASSAASPAKTSTDGSNDDSYPSPTFEGGNSEKVAPRTECERYTEWRGGRCTNAPG